MHNTAAQIWREWSSSEAAWCWQISLLGRWKNWRETKYGKKLRKPKNGERLKVNLGLWLPVGHFSWDSFANNLSKIQICPKSLGQLIFIFYNIVFGRRKILRFVVVAQLCNHLFATEPLVRCDSHHQWLTPLPIPIMIDLSNFHTPPLWLVKICHLLYLHHISWVVFNIFLLGFFILYTLWFDLLLYL